MSKKIINTITHSVKTLLKPWTHLNFPENTGNDYHFAIVSDRAGRPRAGVFENAIDKINKMMPDFVMSVGDYIDGICVEDQSVSFLEKQWKTFLPMVKKCIPPFFFLMGNHDCIPPWSRFPGVHERMEKLYLSHFGVAYYHFIYKNTLFLCLNTNAMEGGGMDEEQLQWALKVLEENKDVCWTFVFQHSPAKWLSPQFAKLEEVLYERNYTVISGDLHQYTKYVRNGRKYFMLGLTGGGAIPGKDMRGVHFGEFDHITWVSMRNGKPSFVNIALDGLLDEDVVTTEKITWLTPDYFRANKKISAKEAKRLREKGIIVENC